MVTQELLKRLAVSAKSGNFSITLKELKEVLPFLLTVNQRCATEVYQENQFHFITASVLKEFEADIIIGLRNKDRNFINLFFRLVIEPAESINKITQNQLLQDLTCAINSESRPISATKEYRKSLH